MVNHAEFQELIAKIHQEMPKKNLLKNNNVNIK